MSGSTSYDTDTNALSAVLAEWTSPRTYEQRTRNISGVVTEATFASRLNGSYFLNVDEARGPVTVHDDNKKDVLAGDGARDWFFANLVLDAADDATKKDKITDLTATEFAADLDFILLP